MKVIALIDKPKSCSGCPFDHVEFAYEECRLSKRQLSEAESLQIPEWCELRPMPNKLDANDWHRMFSGLFSEREAKGYGWNACLDAITGDEDVLHE